MPGETALDSTTAIRYLNGDPHVMARVASLPTIALPLAAGEGEGTLEWGATADEEAAGELICVYEELAPYRAQAEKAYVGTDMAVHPPEGREWQPD